MPRKNTPENDTDFDLVPIQDTSAQQTKDIEFDLRWKIAKALEKRRLQQKITVLQLSRQMNVAMPQVRRLLDPNVKGRVTLQTIVRAAHTLGLEIVVTCTSNKKSTAPSK